MDSQWIYVWLDTGPGLKLYGRSKRSTRASYPLCCTQIVKRAISMITKHFYTILSLTHNNNHLLYTFLYHKVQNEFPYKLSKIRTHYTLFYAGDYSIRGYTFIHKKYMLSLQFTRLIYKHVISILFLF